MISCFTQVHQGFEDLLENLHMLPSLFRWVPFPGPDFKIFKKMEKKLDKFIYIKL